MLHAHYSLHHIVCVETVRAIRYLIVNVNSSWGCLYLQKESRFGRKPMTYALGDSKCVLQMLLTLL